LSDGEADGNNDVGSFSAFRGAAGFEFDGMLTAFLLTSPTVGMSVFAS
jgi:hypothetical protein